jgi:EAL domain-containing protein (putative c-di-GMP-specific phosphodiesterase class I)
MPLALIVDDGRVLELKNLGSERSAQLRTRAGQGPWVEAWRPRPGHAYLADHLAIGLRGQAYAPVRSGATLIGLLTVGSREPDAVALLTERLPAILEFASLAGAILAPTLALTSATAASRGHYRAIIDARAFHPVFQPIVDIASGAAVGYEALTRFDDGTRPDLVFADGYRAGVGLELETATLEAAVAASAALPRWTWLNVNVSPAMLLSSRRLRAVLGPLRKSTGRHLVLELTEHAPIEDYRALVTAAGKLGKHVDLAVDDAGAGFASFRHILELRPRYVKLDYALVHRVGGDPARQALIAGMVHFAKAVDCVLIAEGVETEAERRALGALGVQLAQGYLLGRPEPIDAQALPARQGDDAAPASTR